MFLEQGWQPASSSNLLVPDLHGFRLAGTHGCPWLFMWVLEICTVLLKLARAYSCWAISQQCYSFQFLYMRHKLLNSWYLCVLITRIYSQPLKGNWGQSNSLHCFEGLWEFFDQQFLRRYPMLGTRICSIAHEFWEQYYPPWCKVSSFKLFKNHNLFFFFFFGFLRQGFSVYTWLSWNSLCRPGWPQTQRAQPVSAS